MDWLDFAIDWLDLPHSLILAGTLLVIAGVIGVVIDRKKLGKVDDVPAEASSEARPRLPPLPDLLDSRPQRERRQTAADGDLETRAKRE